MLLVYAVAIGILVGLVTRGRLSALSAVHIRFWPVALVGLLFQALLFSSPLAASVGSLGPSLYVLSTTLVLMSLIVNLRQPGFWLIIGGAFLNFAAIVANGGYMPAAPDAVAALQGVAVLPVTDYTNSAIATGATTLSFLGDIFFLPRPLPLANIFSIGDVLIGVGGAWFVIATMHGRSAALLARRAATRGPQPVSAPNG
jgi:Family of unknown function (DUF5317)